MAESNGRSSKKALVLAGGYGTRLRPLTLKTPKELLPVAGVPAVEYLLENLSRHGFRVVILSVNDTFFPMLENHIGSGRQFGLYSVSYVVEATGSEDKKLGAVGALDFIASQVKFNSNTLIVGADNFSPYFDFSALEESHFSSGATATISLHKFPHKELLSQMGIAEVRGDGKIVKFHEKPKDPPSDLISTAIYYVGPEFFRETVPEYIEKQKALGKKPDNLGDIWEHLLAKSQHLNGFISKEFWIDIGKPQGYLLANEFSLGKKLFGQHYFSKDAVIGEGTHAQGQTLVDGGAKIGKNVFLSKNNHIMKNAVIGDNSRLENCLVFPSSIVGNWCAISNCIVCEGAKIPDGKVISGEHRVLS